MTPIRILLADDHNLLRDGLRLLLERQPGFAVVAEAGDGREALRMAEEHRPDVAVMDVAMPLLNGIDATRRIVDTCAPTSVIILSMHHDESYVVRALNAGARGYLLKDSLKADLIGAVKAVSQGHSYFSPKIRLLLQEDYFREMSDKQKTDSYLQLAAEGQSNKDIASLLNLSLHTVETHRAHILQKLNLHTVPELILYAVRKGIIH